MRNDHDQAGDAYSHQTFARRNTKAHILGQTNKEQQRRCDDGPHIVPRNPVRRDDDTHAQSHKNRRTTDTRRGPRMHRLDRILIVTAATQSWKDPCQPQNNEASDKRYKCKKAQMILQELGQIRLHQ